MIVNGPAPQLNRPQSWIDFGSTLRAVRVSKGIALRKFSGIIGYSPTVVSMVEQGMLEHDSVVLGMCAHLGVPFSRYEAIKNDHAAPNELRP